MNRDRHPPSPDARRRALRSPRRRRCRDAGCSPARPRRRLGAWSTLSFAGTAGAGGNRFVLVILRGGMDGLGAAPAIGDPDFAAARGPLAPLRRADRCRSTRPIALHPQPGRAARDVRPRRGGGRPRGRPAPTASARTSTPSRCSRAAARGRTSSRPAGSAAPSAPSGSKGIALNTAVPLVLRGRADVDTWAPSAAARSVGRPGRAARAHVRRATRRSRPRSSARAASISTRRWRCGRRADGGGHGGAARGRAPSSSSPRRAAEFLGQPNGPQAAVLELGGWDTHANQANPNGAARRRPAPARRRPGRAARRPRSPSGTWPRTVVVVASEFGREVAVNGTLGTDHGTGGVAFVLGGAVQRRPRRRRLARPGAARALRRPRPAQSRPTCARVLKGVLADHLQVAVAQRSRARSSRAARAVRPLSLLRG